MSSTTMVTRLTVLLCLTLINPGAYTVPLIGPGNATGIGLIEIYEIP